MNKTILNKLQFGFEIEGAFDKAVQFLGEKDGEFKEDGSVKVETPSNFVTFNLYEESEEDCNDCNGNGIWTEICECSPDDCGHECDEDNGCIVIDEESHETTENCIHNHESECLPCYDTDNHDRTCETCDGTGRYHNEDEPPSEFASKIFTSFEEMKTHMSQFTKKTHAWDKSCGLHVHIGIKPNKTDKDLTNPFWNIMGNFQFMEKIKQESLTWCTHVKTRLLRCDNMYYKFWENPYDMICTFNRNYNTRSRNGTGSTKYRFARFHEDYNTIEFRFLPPCEHKVQNTENLLSLVTSYLNKKETIATINEELPENEINKAEVILTLEIREEIDKCVI